MYLIGELWQVITTLAETITKQFLATCAFVIIFVIITKIIHQKIFFVMLLPLAGPSLQDCKKEAKELLLVT